MNKKQFHKLCKILKQQDHIYSKTKEFGSKAKASTTPKNKRGNNQRANVTRQFIGKDVRNIFAL